MNGRCLDRLGAALGAEKRRAADWECGSTTNDRSQEFSTTLSLSVEKNNRNVANPVIKKRRIKSFVVGVPGRAGDRSRGDNT